MKVHRFTQTLFTVNLLVLTNSAVASLNLNCFTVNINSHNKYADKCDQQYPCLQREEKNKTHGSLLLGCIKVIWSQRGGVLLHKPASFQAEGKQEKNFHPQMWVHAWTWFFFLWVQYKLKAVYIKQFDQKMFVMTWLWLLCNIQIPNTIRLKFKQQNLYANHSCFYCIVLLLFVCFKLIKYKNEGLKTAGSQTAELLLVIMTQ